MSQAYHDKIEKVAIELKKWRRYERLVSIGRLLFLAVAAYIIYRGLQNESWPLILWSLAPLLLFLGLLFLHHNLKQRTRRLKLLLRVNEEELEFLKGDVQQFAAGSAYLDRDHPYSFDLDIFGPYSLFQHLNRTVTLKGSAALAKQLSSQLPLAEIEEEQRNIQTLTSKLDFRQAFQVEGRMLDEDPELDEKLSFWLDRRAGTARRNWTLHPALLYTLSGLALLALAHWLSVPTLANFYLFCAPALFNILYVSVQLKQLRKEQIALNGLGDSLLMYSRLLKSIEVEQGRDASKRASVRLYQFSRICDAFDQLNNPVGSLLMNSLFLYHLHSLRKIREWKKNNGGSIRLWLREVAQWDVRQSLANWAYNNPKAVYPQISQQPAYSATDLGHPLIAEDQRISNSIDFSSQPITILTGSNMSGKSTFLKTLGMNLILAKIGAPVCASSMKVYPYKVLSSMKMVDSIEKGHSYFQAEVLRLKQVMEELKEPQPAFVLLDEILRGTNSDDKQNGTRLFLERIAQTATTGMIATHDIEIAELAQREPAVFKARFFESRFFEGELHFDYKLRDGVCTTPNATELMRSHGIL